VGKISTILWDFGGVLLTNGWERGSRRLAAEKFNLDWDEFEDRHELLMSAFETGKVSLGEYLQRVIFYEQRSFTPTDFEQFFFEQSQAMPGSLAILSELADTGMYFNAALNNESLELNEYRIKQFNLADYFDAFFSSCYLACRKPEPKIYRLALYITQSTPEECLFVDDRALNLECARELGMRTIQFKSAPQLRADLASEGVKVSQDVSMSGDDSAH
jgi:putative hydrolase of the HAD superfamily